MSKQTRHPSNTSAEWHLELLPEAEELANFGMWRLNLDTNDLKWSDQVYRIHGVSPEEYTPEVETAIAFYHPDDRDRVTADIQRAIETGEGFDFELRLITQQGKERIVYSHAKLRCGDNGERILFGTFQDMTDSYIMHEKKRQEEEIRKLSYSNADLERFAYACSHDLQQPMRIVQSFAMMLKERYEDELDERGQEYLNYIVTSVDQSRALIRDVLELARLESEAILLEQVDLMALMANICKTMKPVLDELDAQVDVSLLPTLRGSRPLYYQIFSNLVGNSVKFHREGVPPVVMVDVEEEGDWWEFSVTDNGIGIEKAFCDEVFTQFKRLNNHADYPGSGLGLTMCKKAVEKYGGSIRCEPMPEHGTRVIFRLPRSLSVRRAA